MRRPISLVTVTNDRRGYAHAQMEFPGKGTNRAEAMRMRILISLATGTKSY